MTRSSNLKKNISISLILTGVSMLISFLMYPLLINLLGVDCYGVWLTIASISTWMLFFEFGLGSGLKNQLGVAVSNNNFKRGRELVSTAYTIIFVIVIIFIIVFSLIKNYINWNSLLGSSLDPIKLEEFASIMIYSYFGIFLLKLIGNIANAHQDPYIEKLISTSISLACFLIISVLLYFHINNIVTVSLWWNVGIIIIWVSYTICLFRRRYKRIAPKFKYINVKYVKSILGLGFQFFIIQISLIIINGSTNFVISHYIGSADVVIYNATYKLFSISNILYSIIIAPTWPAFIDAIEKKDQYWIKKTIKKMVLIWVYISSFMLLILLLSPYIFNWWLGEKISVPYSLSVLLYLYFTGLTFGGVFNMLVNASGKLKVQMISWLIITALYIPLVIGLIKFTDLELYSIPIALLFSNIYYIFIAPIQYKIIIKHV